MRALRELYWANLSEFLSNKRALGLTIAFPVLFIVIFGLVFTNQDKQEARIGLVIEDTGPVGEQLAGKLEALPKEDVPKPSAVASSTTDSDRNPLSSLVFRRGEKTALLDDLNNARLDAVIVLPSNLSAVLLAGGDLPSPAPQAEVELHIDPARQTLIPFMEGVLTPVLRGVEAEVTEEPQILTLKRFNTNARELRTIDYLLPGILAMSIMQLGLFATAQPLIALRVGGVLKRLGATPLRRSTLLVAYVALRLTVALLQTAIIIAIGTLLFKVAIVGSWLALAGWLFLGTLVFLAIGFFMAAVAKNEESAIAAANVINLPMLLLSGVFFPINHLPMVVEKFLIPLIPLNYLADALRHVMVDATPLHSMQTNLLALLAWIVVMTALAVRFFRWEESR
ncbi:MAG: ABC transporter permease [Verrucomicrobia bacterium]|nr:ABC transporter permease [Verrucomicrobiota bacterium]